MSWHPLLQGTDGLPGIMPSAMSLILSLCESNGSAADLSYYEVYMDRCYDLLEVKPKEITILDDKDGQIHLKGLARIPVKSMSDFYEAFSRGIQKRKVAHTGLNDVSSRSHGALVISVRTPRGDSGKLNLIDLAGTVSVLVTRISHVYSRMKSRCSSTNFYVISHCSKIPS